MKDNHIQHSPVLEFSAKILCISKFTTIQKASLGLNDTDKKSSINLHWCIYYMYSIKQRTKSHLPTMEGEKTNISMGVF